MNNSYKSFFGFTIGPIYEVMRSSKKTRELWFGSFFFSWYTRLLCEKLIVSSYELIIPQISGLPKKSRAGFYPDHVIGISKKSSKDTLKELNVIVDKVIEEFAKWIEDLINSEVSSGSTIKLASAKSVLIIIKDYLQTSVVTIGKNGIGSQKEAVEKIENILLACEKNRKYSLGENEHTCFRCKSLPSVVKVTETFDKPNEYNLCPLCYFKLRAHKTSELLKIVNIRKYKPFPPLAYITTKELHGIKAHISVNKKIFIGEKEDLEKKDFKRIVNGKEICDLKTYHKYLAIVNADGDDLGKLISSYDSPSELSKKLNSFSVNAYNIGSKYGVEPIYLGGDDLLVFMPVIYKGNTVFDYILEQKELYQKTTKNGNVLPSISFGVGISYYKYPLSIALEDAQNLLFGAAKNEPGKNSLVLRLTQHSGAKTIIKFSLKDKTLIMFNEFLKEVIKSKKSNKPLHPHSIHHKLLYFRTLLTSVNEIQQIHEFFENQFNEPVHKIKDGIATIKNLLIENISAKDNLGDEVLFNKSVLERQFDNFLAQIKIIKFLIGD